MEWIGYSDERRCRRWPAPTPELTLCNDAISIKSFDLCINENGPEHHTKNFYAMKQNLVTETKLIVRRGQPFKIRLTLNRPFLPSSDILNFIFTLKNDERSSHGRGTMVGFMLKNNSNDLGEAHEWSSTIETINCCQMDVLIKPSCRAPIGEWLVDVDTKISDGDAVRNFKYSSTFYILFNPWCKDDQVYLSDKEALREYILEDTTLIWTGAYNQRDAMPWKLGQYEKDILDYSLLLIANVGKVAPIHRGDPVKISRALSAVVNSPNDNGVLEGCWEDTYYGGKAPTEWVGSVPILHQYFKKEEPVKYGQCWVFSGVLCTIARAIGIPTRIVTNYRSAHDTEGSLNMDYFLDLEGNRLELKGGNDSVWNFHVWNEVWMDRPDIGSEYGGWQAIDATPQEKSDGMYRCGPASVKAIKLGEILRPYDCGFIYSEVNADEVYWQFTAHDQPMTLIKKDTSSVGFFISTKEVGKWEREDITTTYKHSEESMDERDTMRKALKQVNSDFMRYYSKNNDFEDVHFKLNLEDDVKIGETFHVLLQVGNRSDEKTYTVKGSITVETMLYTGKQREKVKSTPFVIKLPPNSKKIIEMEVSFHEYYEKLMDQAAFNISCMASVQDTKYEYFVQSDYRLRKPDIKITFDCIPVADKEINVLAEVTNPLPISLKKGLFQFEGPGIESPVLEKIAEVPASHKMSVRFKYTPPFAGRATLVAKFYCKELNDVSGFLAYEVKRRDEDMLMGLINT